MLSQRHMVAPLYRYTSQVGPRFGDSGSLVEWKRCLNVMVEADIHFRPLHTSILDIHKCLSHWYAVSRAYGCILIPLHWPGWPKIWGLRVTCKVKKSHNVMVEADIYLRLLHTSILDIFKVFETLVCCLKGIWLHPYTVTPARLAPDLGIQVHLRCGNDATTSCLRLMSTSDCFIHP